MKSVVGLLWGTILLLCMVTSTVAQEQVIAMTSLDWPPYTGKDLPENWVCEGERLHDSNATHTLMKIVKALTEHTEDTEKNRSARFSL